MSRRGTAHERHRVDRTPGSRSTSRWTTSASCARSTVRSAPSRTPASKWPGWTPSRHTSTSAVALANGGSLSAPAAIAAELLTPDLENEVIDTCVQFHGGAGFMEETRIARMYCDARARMYCDARVPRIYAGANESMKEIVGRALGLGDRGLTRACGGHARWRFDARPAAPFGSR